MGDAAQAILYSIEVFGIDSSVLAPRNSPSASPQRLSWRKSMGAARVVMHWSLALSRLTGSGSLGSPVPSMVASRLTKWPPEDPPEPPMRVGLMPYFAALYRMNRTARCTSSRGAGYRKVGAARWVIANTV